MCGSHPLGSWRTRTSSISARLSTTATVSGASRKSCAQVAPVENTDGGFRSGDPEANRRFLAGMLPRAQRDSGVVVRVVRELLERRPDPRILDLGGGHGHYAATFARAIDGARVTLFDRPEVLEIAVELSGSGFSLLGGDFHEDDLGGPYDLVFLSNVLHGECEDRCRSLLGRIRRVLAPGGALVIKDLLADERSAPAADAALLMLLYTRAGRGWTWREAVALVQSSGFRSTHAIESGDKSFGILVASAEADLTASAAPAGDALRSTASGSGTTGDQARDA